MRLKTGLFSIPLLLLICAVGPRPALAQDPHFSQYYAAPWTLNPALTGVFNGRWRANINYRDQWSSILSPAPFRTFSASADGRFNVGRDDYASIGLGALHDEAGTARFQQNKAWIGAAFLKRLSGGRYKASHYLSAGAQLGAGQNSIDWGKLWFSRQFDTAAERPDFGADPGESNLGANTRLYADFNAGLLWYVILPNDGYFYAGGALHHINKPIISLADDASQRLYQKWSGMAGGFLPLTDNFGLLPAALWMSQGPATQINAGMNVRYSNNDYNELGFRAGLWARAANKLDRGMLIDALIFTTMFEFNRFTLGLSYDITISPLTRVNNSRGAFEVSLSYFAPEYRRVRTVCPTL